MLIYASGPPVSMVPLCSFTAKRLLVAAVKGPAVRCFPLLPVASRIRSMLNRVRMLPAAFPIDSEIVNSIVDSIAISIVDSIANSIVDSFDN